MWARASRPTIPAYNEAFLINDASYSERAMTSGPASPPAERRDIPRAPTCSVSATVPGDRLWCLRSAERTMATIRVE